MKDGSYVAVSTTYENIGTSSAKASDTTWDTLYICSDGFCTGKYYHKIK